MENSQGVMSLRLKIILGCLALVAIFMLTRLIGYFGSSISLGNLNGKLTGSLSQNTNTINTDRDGDGLPDATEARYNTDSFKKDTDGDGFVDGEELVAGCNPAQQAPRDCLQNKNITKSMSRLILGGIQSGDLAASIGNTTRTQTLTSLADLALQQFNTQLKPPTTDAAPLTGNNTATVRAYVANIRDALDPSLGKPRKELGDQFSLALKQVFTNPGRPNPALVAIQDEFMTSYHGLNAMQVPTSWQSWHDQMRSALYTVATAAKLLQNDQDPFTQALSIKNLQDALTEMGPLVTDLKKVTGQLSVNLAVDDPGGESDSETAGLPGIPGLPGLPETPLPSGFACLLDSCVPVHIKKDDPFTDARAEDEAERKAAKEIMAATLKQLGHIVSGSAQSAENSQGQRSTVPTFVTDWRAYNLSYSNEGAFIGERVIGTALLGSQESPERATACPYFAEGLSQALGAQAPAEEIAAKVDQYRVDSFSTFSDTTKCTLPDDFDYEKYLSGENFNWDDFNNIVSNPTANTPLGYFLASIEEVGKQRDNAKSLAQQEVQANNGGIGQRDAEGNIIIPGSWFVEANNDILKANLDWIISSDEKGEVNGDGEVAVYSGGLTGGVGCNVGGVFPLQLLDQFLQTFTGSGVCEFLGIIHGIINIINNIPIL